MHALCDWGRIYSIAAKSGKSWLRTAAFTAALAALCGTAAAEDNFIDFEGLRGPRDFTSIAPPLTIDHATFSGGQILTNVPRLRRVNRSTVYGASHRCSGCARTITIEFSESVSDVSFMLMNGRMGKLWFEISDDTGHTAAFRLNPYFLAGAATTVTLPSSGIRKIVVGQEFSEDVFWRFYIDNLRYTVNEGREFLVSFSAFVPHDNVPAGPTSFCKFSDQWLPPGLARSGRHPDNNAVWARNGIPAAAGGRSASRGLGGGNGGGEDNRRSLYFAGDNRTFHPAAPTYRLRQTVTVIPDAALDADGVKDGSVSNLAGEARAFAEDAMWDGIINTADEDGVAGDCSLFHQAYLADTNLMDVEVTRTGDKTVEIRMAGTLESPLVGPAQVLGAIDWEFTLALDASTEPVRWTLSGAHDGFPAYEIYINGVPLYQHDPGPGPYSFSKDVRKLLPPVDTEVGEISGELP